LVLGFTHLFIYLYLLFTNGRDSVVLRVVSIILYVTSALLGVFSYTYPDKVIAWTIIALYVFLLDLSRDAIKKLKLEMQAKTAENGDEKDLSNSVVLEQDV
jgi:hypothetical protein